MTISPYLAVRAIGNAGAVQPGRVINGNNFMPLGNSFVGTGVTAGDPANSGLEMQNLDGTHGHSHSTIVQFGDDIFLWQQNRIRQYNQTTEDWDIVHTVSDQEDATYWSYHTGLHFMHAANGDPLLIGLAARNSSTGVVKVKYDGSTWSSGTITAAFNMETSRKGIAVFQNQLYRSNGASIIRYDPITDLVVNQAANAGNMNGAYTDMIVHDDRLLHIAQYNSGDIHELIAGVWIHISNFTGANNTNTPSFFKKNGKLYVLFGYNATIGDGWRLVRNGYDGNPSVDLTVTVLPLEIRDTVAGSGGTDAPNYFTNTRSHVVLDQDSDPENPRVILLIGTALGAFNTVTAYEFIDETQELVKFIGQGNLTGEMNFPHNNSGSGSYHWTKNELNAHITGTRAVQLGEEIDFIAYGDPGFPDKKVRIYFSNEQEQAENPATLISVEPLTSGVSILTDTNGDYVDGVDADGVTVYTVIRDIDADNAVVGQRQALMPYIERTTPIEILVGLEGYWKLNGDLLDSSENGLTLSTTGTVPLTGTGIFGAAATFTGGANYLNRLIDDPFLVIGLALAPFTVQAWVNPSSLAVVAGSLNYICSKSNDFGNGWLLAVEVPSGAISWRQSPAPIITTSPGDIVVGALQHVIVTSDGNRVIIYRNGVELANEASVATTNSTVPFRIGDRDFDDSASWRGVIDEVAVWSRHVTPAQVASLYNAGAGRELGPGFPE